MLMLPMVLLLCLSPLSFGYTKCKLFLNMSLNHMQLIHLQETEHLLDRPGNSGHKGRSADQPPISTHETTALGHHQVRYCQA